MLFLAARSGRNHAHVATILRTFDLELHHAVNLGEQRVIPATAYIDTVVHRCAALTDNDAAGIDGLTTVNLYTQSF